MTESTNTLPEPYQSGRLKPCPFCGVAMESRESEEGERFVHPLRGCLLNGQGWVNNVLNRELWNRRAATAPKTIHGTVQGVKFKECEVYPSSIEGVRFGVKSIHQVKDDVICLVVYRLIPAAFSDGRTPYYYMAVVDEDDDSRATVLLDDGITTIFAEEVVSMMSCFMCGCERPMDEMLKFQDEGSKEVLFICPFCWGRRVQI